MTRNRVAVIGHYIAYGIPIVLRHSGVAARHEQAAVGERAELLRFGAGPRKCAPMRHHTPSRIASGPTCTPAAGI